MSGAEMLTVGHLKKLLEPMDDNLQVYAYEGEHGAWIVIQDFNDDEDQGTAIEANEMVRAILVISKKKEVE